MPEYDRICPVCGKAYVTNIANQKYCCVDCRNQAYGITPPIYENKKCKVCGKEFPWSRTVRNKIYCSKDCQLAGQLLKLKEQTGRIHYGPRTEQKTCAWCGKTFPTRRKNQKYCSSVCSVLMAKSKQSKNTVIQNEERACEYCGKKFIWSSDKSGRKYCSEECSRQATREKTKERECQKKKENKNAYVEEYVRNVVTDLIYRAEKAKESNSVVSYDYWLAERLEDKTRETVLERDHYRCQICGSVTNLFLHYIVSRRKGGDSSPENLITLCDSCHRHIDTGDLDYAISSCYRNARRNRHLEEEPVSENRKELLGNSIYMLQNLFSEFSTYYPDESEYLRRLDTVIDTLERISRGLV